MAFINGLIRATDLKTGLKAELDCAVGGTCCALYAVRVMIPREHYAKATTRCTTKGPAAGEGGRAD